MSRQTQTSPRTRARGHIRLTGLTHTVTLSSHKDPFAVAETKTQREQACLLSHTRKCQNQGFSLENLYPRPLPPSLLSFLPSYRPVQRERENIPIPTCVHTHSDGFLVLCCLFQMSVSGPAHVPLQRFLPLPGVSFYVCKMDK